VLGHLHGFIVCLPRLAQGFFSFAEQDNLDLVKTFVLGRKLVPVLLSPGNNNKMVWMEVRGWSILKQLLVGNEPIRRHD